MSARRKSLWAVEFTVPHAAVAPLQEVLDGLGLAVSAFEAVPGREPIEPGPEWRMQLLASRRPNMKRLRALVADVCDALGAPRPELSVARRDDAELAAGGLVGGPPVRAGRFVVRNAPGDGPGGLLIEPGPAFGTGQHETTRGCLLALDELARRRRFARPLDLGCGSGVLALAMARLWRAPVVASDIDPRAVRETLANARINHLRPWVRAVAAAGFAAPELRGRGRFDIIVANILAGPLVELAPDIRRALAPGGALVLSGLLRRQEREVRAAYRALGFRLRRRVTIGDWPTLVME